MLQYFFCFMFWYFGHKACRNWPGVKHTPLALEGEVLTIGLPRKSPKFIILSTYVINKNGWKKKRMDEKISYTHILKELKNSKN